MQKNRLSFIIQLGEAIRYFHDQKWIHRDICPRNVMVGDSDLVVKLIDFGLVVPDTRLLFRRQATALALPTIWPPSSSNGSVPTSGSTFSRMPSHAMRCTAAQLPWPAITTASLEAVLKRINHKADGDPGRRPARSADRRDHHEEASRLDPRESLADDDRNGARAASPPYERLDAHRERARPPKRPPKNGPNGATTLPENGNSKPQ